MPFLLERLLLLLTKLVLLIELSRARTVFDGQLNVTIKCNFDRSTRVRISLNYWVNISGYVYSPRDLPSKFVSGEQLLTILSIERSLDNLTINCFSINETGRRDVGWTTVLQVISQGPFHEPSRAAEPFGEDQLKYNFQTLNIAQDSNELHLGVVDSKCADNFLQVSVYSPNASQLYQRQNVSGSADVFAVNLRSPGPNFIRVDSVTCASTHYLQVVGSPRHRMIIVTPTDSASFDLPVLEGWMSLQLIWSSADGTQRVCPPNWLIKNCAHNEGDNVITISDGRVHVVNITLNDLKLSFVRLSRRCRECITTESVVAVVRIVSESTPGSIDNTTTQGDNATAPETSLTTTEISAQGGTKAGTFWCIFCAILVVTV